jgi:hypothetical protein
MSVVTWIHEFNADPARALPRNVFRYVLGTSRLHQLFLLALTVGVFLWMVDLRADRSRLRSTRIKRLV